MMVTTHSTTHSIQSGAPANISFERERGVYALEIMRNVAHAVIEVGDDEGRAGRILRVFASLASADVPIFLIKMHRGAVTLAFAAADREKALNAFSADGRSSEVRSDLALVVVRAASMRDLHGIMVNIADALFAAGARLYETGDSHNSVQCLIESERAEAAERELCAKFQLSADAVQHFTAGIEAAR